MMKTRVISLPLAGLFIALSLSSPAYADRLFVCLTEQAFDVYWGTSHAPTPYASMMRAGGKLNKFFSADCAIIKNAYKHGKINSGTIFSRQMSTADKPEMLAGIPVARLILGGICKAKQPLYEEMNGQMVGMGTPCEPYVAK
jgi:hypothetical protein